MRGIRGPFWLMPDDVGDVLGAEYDQGFDWGLMNEFSSDEKPLGYIDEGGGGISTRDRVMYAIDATALYTGEPDLMSLSPPPTSLLLVMVDGDDIGRLFHEESFQHWLSASPTLSSLAIFVPSNPDPLFNVLRNWLPTCHALRSLVLAMVVDSDPNLQSKEMDRIANALCEFTAPCTLHISSKFFFHGVFPYPNPQNSSIFSKLVGKCRSLHLSTIRAATTNNLYANTMLGFLPFTADCKLQELVFSSEQQPGVDGGLFFVDHVSVLKRIERCTLKRLDMRELPPLGAEGMTSLLASLASTACSIHDLGLNLSSIPHFNKTRFLILAQAFQCTSSLTKLKVLRFSHVDTAEAVTCVLEILASPASNCQVRFLDISVRHEPFFSKLMCQGVTPRIECLQIAFLSYNQEQIDSELASLSNFLAQEHSSLLWLQFLSRSRHDISVPEPLQMKVANSLEANLLLTSLRISGFDSPAARSRASAFLARNRLYKAMGLSKDDLIKPHVARLFLCGDGEVGKTTLRKALIKLNLNHPTSSPSNLISQACHDCRSNICFQACKCCQDSEPRTRGLEIHQLSFDRAQKLVMFDLGGQSDYHVFHHYFMTNTSHDLFIVVCKCTPDSLVDSPLAVPSQIEYWLRFIVAHRNTVQGPKPRIMLVLNFFNNATRSSVSLDKISKTAVSLTEGLRQKYAKELDFGPPTHPAYVFGVVAKDTSHARPILEALKMLTGELLEHRPNMIPKLCDELLSITLPSLAKEKQQFTCSFGSWRLHGAARDQGKMAFEKVIVNFEDVKQHYFRQQDQAHQTDQKEAPTYRMERRIRAALTELHNIGQVVFFPPVDVPKQEETSENNSGADSGEVQSGVDHTSATNSLLREGITSPIIVDTNWFCNKVIGNLLAPAEGGFSGRYQWTEAEIRKTLTGSGCLEKYVGEVLRYILSLDLCYRIPAEYSASKQALFFFPAVATDRKLYWPPNFSEKQYARDDSDRMHFYGRRIKCRDAATLLIPSGVFARLQVKLQNFCGEGSYQGYKFGYHWASFVKNKVSVVVRFGRFAAASKSVHHIDDAHASRPVQLLMLPMSNIEEDNHRMSMEEDNHPEWIDILLCCPASQNSQVQGKDSLIMQQIKELIFNICQATSRGIPTVVLEEYALRDEVGEDMMQLEEIKALIIHEHGLASDVTWKDQKTTSVVDLLLPEELHHQVVSHVLALQQIQEEFSYTGGRGGEPTSSNEASKKEGEGDHDHQDLYACLSSESRVVLDLINSRLDRKLGRLGAKMDTLLAKMDDVFDLVKEIKQDVNKVMRGLQQVEVNIVAKCSTGLLEQLLVRGKVPTHCYLTHVDGRLQKLKNILKGRKALVHFLCESHTKGPHVVEGQVGKEVVVEEGILMKCAPFFVPALMVACCAARCAANACLPGVAPLFFDPFLDLLSSIGITKEALQTQILPQALKALFDELDVKIPELFDQKSPLINIDSRQQKEIVEALQKMLGSIQDLDVEKDFGLCLVQVGQRAEWVCREHAIDADQKLPHPPNPFSKLQYC